jgi:nitroreductase
MTINPLRSQSDTTVDETLSFKEAARMRRSIRGFLDKPVPESIIREVLQDARYAPSNCNTQPWNTT